MLRARSILVDTILGLLKQFRLRSMGTPVISEPPGMADFDNQDLLGVELFDALEATLASALDVAPTRCP